MIRRLLTQNRLLFAVYSALTLASTLVILHASIDYSATSISRPILLLTLLSFVPSLVIFAILLPRWKSQPEKVFLLVGIPALLAFAFFMMMGQVPDEMNHIRRAFTLEQPGNDMMIPTCITSEYFPTTYAELGERISSTYDLSSLVPANFNMTAYLPHLYILPYFIMKIAVALGANLYVALYLGRLANVVLYLVAGYWIIRIMPLGRVFMMVYLLNPMLLQQEASLSADAITNIVTMLYIAFTLNARFSERIERKTLVAIAIFFILMALSKFVYVILVFLLLILVPRIEKKAVRIGIYVGSIVITLIAAYVALFMLTWGEYQPTFDLMKEPVECVRVFKNTIVLIAPSYVTMFFGAPLGSFTVGIWPISMWGYIIIFGMSLVFNLGETVTLKRHEKVFIVALVTLFSSVLILFFRYWSTQYDGNYDYITGVQGRYFLPFMNLGLICCSSPQSSLVRKNCLIAYAIALGVFLAIDVAAVIAFFV